MNLTLYYCHNIIKISNNIEREFPIPFSEGAGEEAGELGVLPQGLLDTVGGSSRLKVKLKQKQLKRRQH